MSVSGFGNLSYRKHSFETESECLLIALQAALKVHGLEDDSAPLKCISRLKRSMKKSKVHSYSFSLVPASDIAAPKVSKAPSVLPLSEDSSTASIISELSSAFGLRFKFYSLSSTSSRYRILKVKCAGPSGSLSGLLPFQAAVDSLRTLGFPSVSFSVIKRKDFKERGAVGIVVQCIYCDPEHDQKEAQRKE